VGVGMMMRCLDRRAHGVHRHDDHAEATTDVRRRSPPAQQAAQPADAVRPQAGRTRPPRPAPAPGRLRRPARHGPRHRRPARPAQHPTQHPRPPARRVTRSALAHRAMEEGTPPAAAGRRPPAAHGRGADLAVGPHAAVGLRHHPSPSRHPPAPRAPRADPPLRLRDRHPPPGTGPERRHELRVRAGAGRAGPSRRLPSCARLQATPRQHRSGTARAAPHSRPEHGERPRTGHRAPGVGRASNEHSAPRSPVRSRTPRWEGTSRRCCGRRRPGRSG
jgi:hypothetical protein